MKECSAIISKILGYRRLRRNLGMSAADRNTPKAPIGGTLGGLLARKSLITFFPA